jgi:hypothetical protein
VLGLRAVLRDEGVMTFHCASNYGNCKATFTIGAVGAEARGFARAFGWDFVQYTMTEHWYPVCPECVSERVSAAPRGPS